MNGSVPNWFLVIPEGGRTTHRKPGVFMMVRSRHLWGSPTRFILNLNIEMMTAARPSSGK